MIKTATAHAFPRLEAAHLTEFLPLQSKAAAHFVGDVMEGDAARPCPSRYASSRAALDGSKVTAAIVSLFTDLYFGRSRDGAPRSGSSAEDDDIF